MPFWEFTQIGRCEDGLADVSARGQLDCQNSCLHMPECVGISYNDDNLISINGSYRNHCLICTKATLEPILSPFMYYKRPGNEKF